MEGEKILNGNSSWGRRLRFAYADVALRTFELSVTKGKADFPTAESNKAPLECSYKKSRLTLVRRGIIALTFTFTELF